jgi:uncharacterized membrane protein YdjX (TVP38/TMEM64 family)
MLQDILRDSLSWVQGLGPIAPIGFILIYNLATVLFVPGLILTLGGGVLFGLGFGTVYVFIAATLGATIAFGIGRNFARSWVTEKMVGYPKFEAIDTAVAKNGFKIVLLTRLSPLFPFNVLNYAFGITQVSLKDYVALIGTKNTLLDPETERLQWIAKIIGFIVTIGVTIYITRIAQKALDQTIKE